LDIVNMRLLTHNYLRSNVKGYVSSALLHYKQRFDITHVCGGCLIMDVGFRGPFVCTVQVLILYVVSESKVV